MTPNRFEIVRIRIAGDWRDAWLYKEHLLLWSRTGMWYVLPIRRIIQHIKKEASSAAAVVLEYLLFRNDWKTSEQFKRILEIESLSDLFISSIRDCGKTIITLPEGLIDPIATEAIPGILLDAEIYANRVYLATTNGLFESYFNPKYATESQPLLRRLDHRVRQVRARYASVNAAAEEQGLWFAHVFLGEDRWWEGIEKESFQRIADTSLSASFSSRHLLNYTEEPIPAFLRADTVRERLHPNANWDEWRVVNYQRPADITQLTEHALRTAHRTALTDAPSLFRNGNESIMALGNWDYRLLLAWQHSLHTVNISAYDEHQIEARPGSFHQVDMGNTEPETDILATYPIAGGFLTELFDRILLITPTGAHAFFAGPAAKVRTFTQSRRYQDVAIIVEERGISLVGSFKV